MQSLNNSKLMKLLLSLNNHEFKELGLWVNSPIHNSSKRTVSLYDAFKMKFKNNSPVELPFLLRRVGILQKGKKQKDISPKDIQEFRIVASKLTIQIEEYLIWKKNNENTVNNKIALMDQLATKRLYDMIPPVLNKTSKQLTDNPLRDFRFIRHKYKLDEMRFYGHLTQKNRLASESLKQVVKSLQNSCLTQLLRYYAALVNSRNLISGKEEFSLMNNLINFLENSEEIEDFTVKIYFKQLLLLDQGKAKDYYEFKVLLFHSFDAFDTNEIRQFLGFMSNFCIVMVNRGNLQFQEERLEIYQTGLSKNCWNTGIYFSHHHFVNIVITGLSIEENNWVESFIESYQDQLNPAVQKNTVNLSIAMLQFELKNYSNAHSLLNQVSKSEDFLHHALMEVLLIKIYYQSETLTFENFSIHPIHSRIKSFNAYLKIASGKKLSPHMKSIYTNFVVIIKQIINIHKKSFSITRLDKKAISKLDLVIQELQTNCTTLTPLTERQWLLAQIKAL